MLLEVSGKLVNETDIRRLGLQLNVPHYVIGAKLGAYTNTIVARHVLKMWFNNQRDRKVAYHVLGQALIDVNLSLIAGEVLNYP